MSRTDEDPVLDAIRGNAIWGVQGVPGEGTVITIADGGAALELRTGDNTNRPDVSNTPPVFYRAVGAQFDQPDLPSQPAPSELNPEDVLEDVGPEDVDPEDVDPVAFAKRMLKDMEDELRDKSEVPFKGPKYYIPHDVLYSVITLDRIRAVLPCLTEGLSPEKLVDLAQDIYGRGEDDKILAQEFRKIFAILILIDKPDSILDFVKAGITDTRLPLKKVGEGRMFRLALAEAGAEDKPIRLFNRGWKQGDIERFEEKQWETLAPFFSRGGLKEKSWVQRYVLTRDHPLPFEIILPSEESTRATPSIGNDVQEATRSGSAENPSASLALTRSRTVGTAAVSGVSTGRVSALRSASFPPGSITGGNSEVWKVKIRKAHHSLKSYRV